MVRRVGRDLVIAAGPLLLVAASFAAGSAPAPAATAWLLAGALLALGTTVVLHRSRPTWSLCLATPVALWNAGGMRDNVPMWNALLAVVVFAVIHLAGRHADREAPALAVLAVGAVVGAPALALEAGDGDAGTAGAVALLCGVAFPWFAGRYRWLRATHRERERRLLADRERSSERARIARDMHDSLGHELSLIALRAGALELTPGLDERHRAAAGDLRLAAAGATDRLQQVIGVLRADTGPEQVPPAHDSVAGIVESTRAAGATVDLARQGEARALSPLVDHAVHRVVQEALTNAVRHAPGAPIAVRLAFRPDDIEVTVTNDAAAGPPPAGDTGGRGLIGLDERVHLAGGTLRAAPRQEGGFEVVARLPDTAPSRGSARTGTGTTEGAAQ